MSCDMSADSSPAPCPLIKSADGRAGVTMPLGSFKNLLASPDTSESERLAWAESLLMASPTGSLPPLAALALLQHVGLLLVKVVLELGVVDHVAAHDHRALHGLFIGRPHTCET